MLHGGVNPSTMYGTPLAEMAKDFKVIVIHARGHGFSKDTDAPWSYGQAADDVAAVLKALEIEKVSVMGYSNGGGTGLQFAKRHPEMVERLIVISYAFASDGNYPEILSTFEQMPGMADAIGANIAQSPLAQLYPDVDWTTLIRKTGNLNKREYDWSQIVQNLASPTLLMFADADSVRPAHIAEFYELLGGGQRDAGMDGSLRSPNQLAIIPDTTHYNLMTC